MRNNQKGKDIKTNNDELVVKDSPKKKQPVIRQRKTNIPHPSCKGKI